MKTIYGRCAYCVKLFRNHTGQLNGALGSCIHFDCILCAAAVSSL